MVELRYTPEHERPPRKASVSINGVLLTPGINRLSKEQFEILLASDSLERYQKWGAIELITPIEDLFSEQIQIDPDSSPPLAEPITSTETDLETLPTPKRSRKKKEETSDSLLIKPMSEQEVLQRKLDYVE